MWGGRIYKGVCEDGGVCVRVAGYITSYTHTQSHERTNTHMHTSGVNTDRGTSIQKKPSDTWDIQGVYHYTKGCHSVSERKWF